MSKSRGTYYERKLVNAFWEAGFGVMRAPTSGGATSRALPDIVAGNGKVYYAIEVKMKKELPVYIREEQVEEIKEFSRRFGAKAFIAVKLPYKEWRFVPVELLSKNGKNYRVGEEEYLKGLRLEDLLEGLVC
ncbi:Holliday junction resolvase [bacterium]|nr:Holliday junction resolvase [bacterium]